MKKYLISVAIGLVLQSGVGPAFADGTLDFAQEVQPILMQRPYFAKFLLDTFDFDKSAQAVTVGRAVNPTLAGLRIGPYTVFAKKKGTAGPYTTAVVIDTYLHYLDAKGVELDDLQQAVSVKEDFYAVEINPMPGEGK